MTSNSSAAQQLDHLAQILKDAHIVMLSTVAHDRSLVARPMALQEAEFNGDLWLFTSRHSRKVQHISSRPDVVVSFSNDKDSSWVSISGIASIVEDNQKITDLWNPLLKAWFPDGVGSPELVLIKISAISAEYWDSPKSKVVKLYEVVKGAATRQPANLGENEKIDLTNGSL